MNPLQKLLFIVFPFVAFSEEIDFHSPTTGVIFSAYVKKGEGENGEIPDWKSYKNEDMEAMLQVISTRFTKVATFGVGADNVPYAENKTYYESNAQVLTGEEAAKINKKWNRKLLTVLLGIWQSSFSLRQTSTEIQVAMESARKANAIYPGTVEGVLVSGDKIESNAAELTLTGVKFIKEDKTVAKLKLKVGTTQSCYGITHQEQNQNGAYRNLSEIRRNIIKNSDFVICQAPPAQDAMTIGPENGFGSVKDHLLEFRNELKKINPKIEVMGSTGWASDGGNEWENVGNMTAYWKFVDNWANKNKFTMWMTEAIDNPWKTWSSDAAHFGWWKLLENNGTGYVSGYEEKATGKVVTVTLPPPSTTTTDVAQSLGNNFVLMVAATVLQMVAFCYSTLV